MTDEELDIADRNKNQSNKALIKRFVHDFISETPVQMAHQYGKF